MAFKFLRDFLFEETEVATAETGIGAVATLAVETPGTIPDAQEEEVIGGQPPALATVKEPAIPFWGAAPVEQKSSLTDITAPAAEQANTIQLAVTGSDTATPVAQDSGFTMHIDEAAPAVVAETVEEAVTPKEEPPVTVATEPEQPAEESFSPTEAPADLVAMLRDQHTVVTDQIGGLDARVADLAARETALAGEKAALAADRTSLEKRLAAIAEELKQAEALASQAEAVRRNQEELLEKIKAQLNQSDAGAVGVDSTAGADRSI
jgi:hypothetical protein